MINKKGLPYTKDFEITSVCLEDLDGAGFDVSQVDEFTMVTLARKMADAYCEDSFWLSLDIIAEYLEIPKKK